MLMLKTLMTVKTLVAMSMTDWLYLAEVITRRECVLSLPLLRIRLKRFVTNPFPANVSILHSLKLAKNL